MHTSLDNAMGIITYLAYVYIPIINIIVLVKHLKNNEYECNYVVM